MRKQSMVTEEVAESGGLLEQLRHSISPFSSDGNEWHECGRIMHSGVLCDRRPQVEMMEAVVI
jgi:hypothetical protein